MAGSPWTPWHLVVRPRADVRTGERSLSIFAAGLYDVVMGRARPVYQDPRDCFAFIYSTVARRDTAACSRSPSPMTIRQASAAPQRGASLPRRGACLPLTRSPG